MLQLATVDRAGISARHVRESAPMRTPSPSTVLALAMVVGCHSRANDHAPAGDAAPSPPVAKAMADAGAQTASKQELAKRIVRSWNDALDRHDIDALGTLYAPTVAFYGTDAPRAAVLAAKKRALGRGSTFEQRIASDLEVADAPGGGVEVTFTKRSGTGGKLVDVRAIIVVAGDVPAITQERDAASDARAERQRDERCFDAVTGTVSALPAVKRILGKVEADLAKFPDHRMGGIGPMRVDDGSVTGALGVHSDERFEAMVWYSVAPDGKLEVTAPEALAVSPADAARVKVVCARK